MRKNYIECAFLVLAAGMCACTSAIAAPLTPPEFHRAVYTLAEQELGKTPTRVETEAGEYAGSAAAQYRYIDSRYYDVQSGRLIARIRRDANKPEALHIVEVNIYDSQGKVIRDYGSISLPWAPQLPVRTMINLHQYPGELHSFRQFDMYGDAVYESCSGRLQNRPLRLDLEGTEMEAQANTPNYHACFDGLSKQAQTFLNPN